MTRLKRLTAVLLAFCLIAALMPASVAAGEAFNASTMTITGLTKPGSIIFPNNDLPMISFTGTSYTFTDSAYDALIEDAPGIAIRIHYSGETSHAADIYLRRRQMEPSPTTIVSNGIISGLAPFENYQYSVDNGVSWISFTSTPDGSHTTNLDVMLSYTLLLRVAANNSQNIPASYSLTIDVPGQAEPDEDEISDLKFDLNTLTVTGLFNGASVYAFSGNTMKEIKYNCVNDSGYDTFVISDAEYDALFNPSDSNVPVRFTVSYADETYIEVFLTPRPATPSYSEFDLDNWMMYGLIPETKYQCAGYAALGVGGIWESSEPWVDSTAGADGSLKVGLVDRSSTYTSLVRVAASSTAPPSYGAPFEVTRYVLTGHYLSVDLDEELIYGFDEDTKYQYQLSTKPGRWSSLSLNRKEPGTAKLSKFIPRSGTLEVLFREKADRGEPENEPFDKLVFAARPVISNAKNEKPMPNYMLGEDETAVITNTTSLMEFAEKPERGDPYDWEIGLDEQEFDLPEKTMRIYYRISPADDEENLVRGAYDVFTPASKIKNVSIKAIKKAPKLKINARKNTLTIKKGYEYWMPGQDIQLVTEKKGLVIDLSEVAAGTVISVRVAATEKAPQSMVQQIIV